MFSTRFPITNLDLELLSIVPKGIIGRIIFILIFGVIFLFYFIFNYFVLIGFVQLTIHSIIFKWLSLLAESPIGISFSLLEIFSDFGLFFTLLLIIFYIVINFINLIKSFFKSKDIIKEGAKVKFYNSKYKYNQKTRICCQLSLYAFFSLAMFLIMMCSLIINGFLSQNNFSSCVFTFEILYLIYFFISFLVLSFVNFIINKCDDDDLYFAQIIKNWYYNSDVKYYICINEKNQEIQENPYIILDSENEINEQINKDEINNNESNRDDMETFSNVKKEYDINNISLMDKILGAILLFFKNSNFLKVALLEGMIFNQYDRINKNIQIIERKDESKEPKYIEEESQQNFDDISSSNLMNDSPLQLPLFGNGPIPKIDDKKRCGIKCICKNCLESYMICIEPNCQCTNCCKCNNCCKDKKKSCSCDKESKCYKKCQCCKCCKRCNCCACCKCCECCECNNENSNCCKCHLFKRPLWYKILVVLLLFAMQLSYFVYNKMEGKLQTKEMIGLLIIRLLLFEKIIQFNLIDLFVYPKKVWWSLKENAMKGAYFIILALYFIMSIFVIVHINNPYKFSTIQRANYFENNETWYKNGMNKKFVPESFCYVESPLNNIFKTEDLAMLATLPRLYGINEDDECYIKPSMRGLFNSTMKYIFGKNFENDEIYIYCKPLSHYPVLVITSEKILNKTLEYFNDNITFIDKQIIINNTNYFEDYPIESLSEEGKNLLNVYEKCSLNYGPDHCEFEWDNFTQYYWPNMFSNDFINIPGFERYQINIDDDFVFQPRFITSDGIQMAGTHFIVGGSFEDKWGIGFLIEAMSRKYSPMIFQNIFPLYSLLRSKFKDIFINLEFYNSYLLYNEPIIKPGIKKMTELYSQFNFSHESIFTIGHAVGGTIMKGISYYTDIRGIAFESSDAENTVKNIFDKKFYVSDHATNRIVNIYSSRNFFSGLDDDCFMNNKYLKGIIAPTVYKTACLTAITCSENMKYVPFCKQTFSRDGKNSEKEFNYNLEAYLKEYGFK